MKFLHYAALIATTSAVRLQATQVEPSFETLMSVDKHVPSPEEIWEHFDANHDGEWDLKEAKAAFKGAMEYFGHKLPKGWKKMVKKEFKKADTDKSGKVSPKEMGAYIFEAVDANDDGLISLDELLDAIKAIAKFSKNKLVKGWKKMVKDAVKGVDTDGDGKASPAELWKAIEEHGIPDINDLFEDNSKALKLADLLQVDKNHVPTAQEIWDHFDTNGDDQIDLQEAYNGIEKAAKHYGHKLPKGWKKGVKKDFEAADTNNNGTVSKYELAVALFKAIDGNNDGVISLDEMKDAVRAIAKISKNQLVSDWEDQVEGAFNAVDTNNNGTVCGKEAWAALKKYKDHDINGLFKE